MHATARNVDRATVQMHRLNEEPVVGSQSRKIISTIGIVFVFRLRPVWHQWFLRFRETGGILASTSGYTSRRIATETTVTAV